MDLMDIQDISYIDYDELGVRPLNFIDDSNDIDFDDNIHGYYGKDKQDDLKFHSHEKKLLTDESDAIIPDDDDNSTYEIDPETGEKIFREVSVLSSPSFSITNEKWIETYLSNIEPPSSTTINRLTTTTTITPTSGLLFEGIELGDDQTEPNWFSNYISLDESTNNIMFNDQLLSGQYIDDDHNKNPPQTTSPILIPLSNTTKQNSIMNLLSVSLDDEYSLSSNSNNSRLQRSFSPYETDSELTFDGSCIETKLEKIEHDEHLMTHMFARRSSTRANYQGQQDEDTLRRYNIPLALYDITQSSTEEYNRHLARLSHLSQEQIHLIKDIRRRGKNKIAAQNCRKRKAINVESLLEEVDDLKRLKHDLEQRKKSFQQQIIETRNQYEYLHRQVLPDRQLPPAIIVK
ncbi:unnamed protein product [Adineta steineri]|uniref:BZIP domain-containing protein n=1 Tax=Adineta steineri TaxID=433720 RepID=A0A813NTE3_9BILA|nr:unnamed protein product [Adineta steineri]CAF0771785.1 unnamed protein product [Adineta steineri]